jgi:hypothetical protein
LATANIAMMAAAHPSVSQLKGTFFGAMVGDAMALGTLLLAMSWRSAACYWRLRVF